MPVFKINVYFKGHSKPVSMHARESIEDDIPSDVAKGLWEFLEGVKPDGWVYLAGTDTGPATTFRVDQISHIEVLP